MDQLQPTCNFNVRTKWKTTADVCCVASMLVETWPLWKADLPWFSLLCPHSTGTTAPFLKPSFLLSLYSASFSHFPLSFYIQDVKQLSGRLKQTPGFLSQNSVLKAYGMMAHLWTVWLCSFIASFPEVHLQSIQQYLPFTFSNVMPPQRTLYVWSMTDRERETKRKLGCDDIKQSSRCWRKNSNPLGINVSLPR